MANVRIKELMEESRRVGCRVTQADLAKDAGVAQQTIARLANNQRKRLDPVILQSLADTFSNALNRKITIYDLIEDDEQIEKPDPVRPTDNELPPAPLSIEDKIDHLSQQIASVRGDIGEMRQDMNEQMADVHNEISKLSKLGE